MLVSWTILIVLWRTVTLSCKCIRSNRSLLLQNLVIYDWELRYYLEFANRTVVFHPLFLFHRCAAWSRYCLCWTTLKCPCCVFVCVEPHWNVLVACLKFSKDEPIFAFRWHYVNGCLPAQLWIWGYIVDISELSILQVNLYLAWRRRYNVICTKTRNLLWWANVLVYVRDCIKPWMIFGRHLVFYTILILDKDIILPVVLLGIFFFIHTKGKCQWRRNEIWCIVAQ